jgi:hypothetical protein
MLTAAFVDCMIEARVAEARSEQPPDLRAAVKRAEAAEAALAAVEHDRDNELRRRQRSEAALAESVAERDVLRARLAKLEDAASRTVSARYPWRRRRELRRLARLVEDRR